MLSVPPPKGLPGRRFQSCTVRAQEEGPYLKEAG